MENQCNTKDRSTDKYTILDSINKDDSKPKHLIIDKRAGSHANLKKCKPIQDNPLSYKLIRFGLFSILISN